VIRARRSVGAIPSTRSLGPGSRALLEPGGDAPAARAAIESPRRVHVAAAAAIV
jgi:hypothetical protein